MPKSGRPLCIFAQASAALGLLSITLTGEITPLWLMASWTSWTLSLIAHRFPLFLARRKHFETVAVIGLILMLFVDFLILRVSIFIALTHFLLLFQIVKLLGKQARKDCFQLFMVSFFQILASC